LSSPPLGLDWEIVHVGRGLITLMKTLIEMVKTLIEVAKTLID